MGGFPASHRSRRSKNYVFGVDPPTVDDLHGEHPEGALGIVVFALEYRPGARTPHRRHADLCFSRTAIARVGTAATLYNAEARQFEPLDATMRLRFGCCRHAMRHSSPFSDGQDGVYPDRFVPVTTSGSSGFPCTSCSRAVSASPTWTSRWRSRHTTSTRSCGGSTSHSQRAATRPAGVAPATSTTRLSASAKGSPSCRRSSRARRRSSSAPV